MNNKPTRLQIARADLLVIIIFTLVNVILPLLGINTYFLFSASIPYSLAMSFEEDVLETGASLDYILAGIVLTIGLLIPYFIAWLCSKKHPKMLIIALVLFAIDTIYLLVAFNISLILDLAIHIYILVATIQAIKENK